MKGAFAASSFVLFACGCATINPTLTPARVLPRGHVVADLGSGYDAPVAAPALTDARIAAMRLTSGTGTADDQSTVARGAAAFGSTPPGVAGYFAVRTGVGNDTEVQVSQAGRTIRAGARHLFWADSAREWVLSLGAQARVAPLAVATDGTIPGLSVQDARLYGGDVSALLGQTNSDLYDIWIGLRAGYTHGDATMRLTELNGGAPFGAHLDRLDAALTLGLRVGFGHVAAMAEIEVQGAYFWAASSDLGVSTSGALFALVPAGALSFAF